LSGQPIYRPLKIFALGPSVSKLEGATALVNVPYEPLDPGPVGSLFAVSGVTEEDKKKGEEPLNLESKLRLRTLRKLLTPSPIRNNLRSFPSKGYLKPRRLASGWSFSDSLTSTGSNK
jgi:hypothetical protein